MTPGIGLALIAMVCFGAGDLLFKRAAQAGIESRHFIMLQAWGFCPTITLYAWWTGNLQVGPSAIWGALAGLCARDGRTAQAAALLDEADALYPSVAHLVTADDRIDRDPAGI